MKDTFSKPYKITNLYTCTYVANNVSDEPVVPIFYTEQTASIFLHYYDT
jgi:hypothetical protein